MPENEKIIALRNLMTRINFNEKLVRDNKIEFEYKGEKYRVRMPNVGEELEAHDKKNQKYIQLLNDDKYMTKKQLIKVYKKKEIDIEALDNEIKDIQEKMANENLRLAKFSDNDKKAIESSEDKILELRNKLLSVSEKRTDLLQFCIESKIEHYWYLYLTFLVTEKTQDKQWVKCFKTFKEFENTSTELAGRAIGWTTSLLMGLRNPLD